jgi:hypothetical protein
MSKIKLLLDVANDLRTLADSISAVVDAMADNAESTAPAEAPNAKTVTLEQVRAVLVAKSHDGHTAEIRTLLEKHGADKLSAINPAEYAVLLAEAEGIGNG